MPVAAGLTVSDGPVPNNVPPQVPLYHFQFAPCPSLPPLTEKVLEVPKQIVEEGGLMGEILESRITTDFTAHVVLLHRPSAR